MIEASALFPGIVHWVQGSRVVASRNNRIYVSYDGGESWEFLYSIPIPSGRKLMSTSRLGRRLFRTGISHICCLKNRMVVIGYGFIYSISLAPNKSIDSVTPVCGSRPLTLCAAGDRILYYGEYRGNQERTPVHVFASENGGVSWHPVFQFQKIRHIHGVFYDPYAKVLWITTGDDGEESGIFLTQDRFRSVEKILGGTQQMRVIHLLFTEEHVYFGSDTPLERNHLYRFSRLNGKVDTLQEVEGSVFHGFKADGNLFLSTACEPSEINKSRNASVWMSSDGQTWEQILIRRKDIWPMKLFQYGQILFPSGEGGGRDVWVTPFATHGDQQSVRIRI